MKAISTTLTSIVKEGNDRTTTTTEEPETEPEVESEETEPGPLETSTKTDSIRKNAPSTTQKSFTKQATNTESMKKQSIKVNEGESNETTKKKDKLDKEGQGERKAITKQILGVSEGKELKTNNLDQFEN